MLEFHRDQTGHDQLAADQIPADQIPADQIPADQLAPAQVDAAALDADAVAAQANTPERIVAAVAAAAAGCDRAADIAAAIGAVPRQGGYYANAAHALGLLDRVDDDTVRWQPTGLGADLAEADSDTAAATLATLMRAHSDVALLADHGEDALAGRLAAAGLSGETVRRRVACAHAWRAFADEHDAARAHRVRAAAVPAAAAAATIAAERAARRAAAAPRYCAACYVQLPAGADDDVCDLCA